MALIIAASIKIKETIIGYKTYIATARIALFYPINSLLRI
jgi:hypothetical protein